jgi:hypothetical protein
MVERALQMAESCVVRLQPSHAVYTEQVHEYCNVDKILSNIFYFRICDSTEQVILFSLYSLIDVRMNFAM